MRLVRAKVSNVGVLADVEFKLDRASSVIVGRNNSGKTTALSAMAGTNPLRKPRKSAPDGFAYVEREFEIEWHDLIEAARRGPVRVPRESSLGLKDIVSRGKLRIVERVKTPFNDPQGMARSRDIQWTVDSGESFVVSLQHGRESLSVAHERTPNANSMHEIVEARIFRFDAERERTSAAPVRPIARLDSRARDLIAAFDQLRSSRKLDFLKTVQRVLPEVRGLDCVPSSERQGEKELRVWFSDELAADASYSLAEVGYGTPNVIAILFAATMEGNQRILLIDEPATFLHPGAVRELMCILAEHPQHQYVFATHSMVGLEHFPEASFSLCRRDPGTGCAVVENCGAGAAADTRRLLGDVGASLSDVFAADQIIWVEGPSDVDALKEAIKQLPEPRPRGLAVLPLVDTGGLEGKHGDLIAEVYRKLSTSSALIPRALHFVLVREGRSDGRVADLERRLAAGAAPGEDPPGLSVYPAKMLENLFPPLKLLPEGP